jgi:hypothetical protein
VKVLLSRHLTQACIIFCPHVPAPSFLQRLLANSKITQGPHKGYNDDVSFRAKPSFAFDEPAYLINERLFLGIKAILAPVQCLDYAETMKICEFFALISVIEAVRVVWGVPDIDRSRWRL